MAFEPVGIAARRVVASLEVRRQERKRAAENDNRPPKAAPKRGGEAQDARAGAATLRGAGRGRDTRPLGRPGGQSEI